MYKIFQNSYLSIIKLRKLVFVAHFTVKTVQRDSFLRYSLYRKYRNNNKFYYSSIRHTLLHSYLLYFTSLIPNYQLFLFTNLSTNDSCIKFLH